MIVFNILQFSLHITLIKQVAQGHTSVTLSTPREQPPSLSDEDLKRIVAQYETEEENDTLDF